MPENTLVGPGMLIGVFGGVVAAPISRGLGMLHLGPANALLGAAAFLPKAEPAGLSASLLLGLVGATILLGLTIAFAFG